ncbi:MAG: nitroreductase family protein [Muribaculaceae bacterium]|nr:nitroreductase family protein [Muribaculaceae bacterium]
MKNPENYFQSRRTVRRFSGREVPPALVESILERAVKAPTCGNMQLYTVIVTREPARREALAAAHFNQPAAADAPVLLTVCADFNRFTRWCALRGADAGFDNFLSFTSAVADATALTQQIATIAEMEGLGTCWLGTVTFNAPAISKLLRLPELVVPVGALALGWPAEEGEETERLPMQAVVAQEEYPEWSDGEVLRLFKSKEEYAPNMGYVKENGKDNLAQVFAEVRYPRSMNESLSEVFLKYLAEQGFLPEACAAEQK